MKQIYTQITDNIVSIFIYVIDHEMLDENEINELKAFRTIVPNEPILFVRIDEKNS